MIIRYFSWDRGADLIRHFTTEASVAGGWCAPGAPLTAPRQHVYTLVEVLPDGSLLRETFPAPDTSKAIARAEKVFEGDEAELWCHQTLICSWRHWPRETPAEPEGDVLETYALYFFTPGGRFVRRDVFAARDDEAAVEMAQRPGEQCVTELWRRGARVRAPQAEPATVRSGVGTLEGDG